MGEEISQLNFSIRQMIVDDLPVVARIHKNAYREDHFSSRLNIGLLVKYYGFLLKYNSFCFVAIKDDQVAGFLVSGENTRIAVRNFIRNNFFSLILVLLKNPTFIASRIKNYFKIFFTDKSNVSLAEIRLLSVAIDLKAESKGIATSLIKMLEEEVRRSGRNYIGLSVHEQNRKAIRLYEHLGWQLERVEGSALYYIIKL
jgi:ribosomal protein S18 acetylase RimI-like enzyme